MHNLFYYAIFTADNYMFQARIYGTEVISDIQLFKVELSSGKAIDENNAIRLTRAEPDDLQNRAYKVSVDGPRVHGQTVRVCSDRMTERIFDQQVWCFEVEDVARFHGRGGESRIFYEVATDKDLDRIPFWFVHVLLPTYLTVVQEYVFLHSAAVEIEGEAVIFLAQSCGGKSTLASQFLSAGHALISDDKLAFSQQDDCYQAIPAHPHNRPNRNREDLGVFADAFMQESAPVRAIFILEESAPGEGIEILPITAIEAFTAIAVNSMHSFPFLKKRQLDLMAGLADRVNVYRLKRPWGIKYLPDVYRAIRLELTDGV